LSESLGREAFVEEEDRAQLAGQICAKLKQYFGDSYEVSSNNVDVFTIRTSLEPRAYIESQDITVVRSIAEEFGLSLESWKIIVANKQMGVYCVLSKPVEFQSHWS
jgi:hypothetical protein